MPNLSVNTANIDDVRAGIAALQAILAAKTGVSTSNGEQRPSHATDGATHRKIASLKHKGIWPFLSGAASLEIDEYSLPELGGHLGLSSAKVCSLKAILAKPEKRLAITFFEPAPSGSADDAGNPRVRLVPAVRDSIRLAAVPVGDAAVASRV